MSARKAGAPASGAGLGPGDLGADDLDPAARQAAPEQVNDHPVTGNGNPAPREDLGDLDPGAVDEGPPRGFRGLVPGVEFAGDDPDRTQALGPFHGDIVACCQ